MKVRLETKYLGHSCALTFESDIEEDLSQQQVEERIGNVMRRELQRFAEISAVGVKDKKAAEERAAEQRRRRASGEPEPEKGPAITLAAGTKDPVLGRIVHDGSEAEQQAKREQKLAAGRK